jgi:ubiquinone/menaquinone biosynthesis C-methylase UbiE
MYEKHGNVYDFRIQDRESAWDNSIRPAYNDPGSWLSSFKNHYSEDDLKQAFFDPHVKEIESYLAKLSSEGVDTGKRYDEQLLIPGSVRDLHEMLPVFKHLPKQLSKESVFLDLGAGTLRVTKELLRRGYGNILAVDLSSDGMVYGYEKLNLEDKEKVLLIQADVRFLPFKTHKIDSIISLELFEHIDAPKLLLLELKRILSLNGEGLINTWNGVGLTYQTRIKEKGASFYSNGFFYKFYCKNEIDTLLSCIAVNSVVKPYGFYVGRKLSHILGPWLLPVSLEFDGLFSKVFPASMFAFLLINMKQSSKTSSI